jgi:hypothetical protein
VTSAAIYASNVTATNIVGTTITTGTILSTGNSNTIGSIITTGGNAGIGTTSPIAKLNVQADASGTYMSDSGQIIISGATNSNKRLGIAIDTTNNVGILQGGLSGATTYPISLNPGGSNVGINTTSPETTLDIKGTFRATTSMTSGAVYATNVTATNIVGITVSTGILLATTSVTSGALYANNVTATNIVGTTVSAGTILGSTVVSSANITALLITTGTLNAATRISSANISSSIISTGTLVGSTININGTTRITNILENSIGTLVIAGPGSSLYLPAITTVGQLMSIYGPGGVNVISNVDLSTFEPTPSAMSLPAVRFSMQDLGGWNTSLNILTKNFGNTGTMASRIFIDGSGNIGIGTTSPGELCDIRGNLRIGNSTQGNYISFCGTYGDGEYAHTFIGERIYGGSEQSELLLLMTQEVL